MISDSEKLDILVESEGYEDVLSMLESTFNDGSVPSICMNEDCDYTTYMEPDQQEGWCEECEENTVKSCQVLGGII